MTLPPSEFAVFRSFSTGRAEKKPLKWFRLVGLVFLVALL